MTDPCGKLRGFKRKLCDGTSGLSPERVADYIELFRSAGQLDSDFPPLVQQAANLVSAGKRAATSVATGKPVKVSREVKDERAAICLACVRRHEKRCLECGCVLTAKQWSATEDCPLGKWPPLPQ